MPCHQLNPSNLQGVGQWLITATSGPSDLKLQPLYPLIDLLFKESRFLCSQTRYLDREHQRAQSL